ncbi:MAG: hypothetical protein ABJ215_00745 [Alphaproteobacteria bacterium]
MTTADRTSNLKHLVRVAGSAVAFRILPVSTRNMALLLVSVFDVLLYAGAFSVVLSTIFSLSGWDRFILMLLGLIVVRWSLGCAVQASRLAGFTEISRPFLRYPVVSTAIVAMGHPTLIFALSMGLLIPVLLLTGSGVSSTPIIWWGLYAVGVQAFWNFLLVLLVLYMRTHRWFVSEMPVFLGFALLLIISPVFYQFPDIPLAASRILTSFNPGSHLLAAYHNALWFGRAPSLEVLPWTVAFVIIVAAAMLRMRFGQPTLLASFGESGARVETLTLRSGLWLHDHDYDHDHDHDQAPGEGLTRFRPWRGELPWMTGRELLRLLFHDRDERARAVRIFTGLSPRDQEDVTLDLLLPVFPDRIRDRLCCAAALAKPGGVFLDRLLDLMEPEDIQNINLAARNKRQDGNAPLRVRARAGAAQHLVRGRNH